MSATPRLHVEHMLLYEMQWKRVRDDTQRAKQLLQRLDRYNLSLEEFKTLGEASDWNCWSCGESKPLVIDHDHKTGRVRGLLCGRCNSGIGFFGDTLEGVLNAARYLLSYEESSKGTKT